MTIWRQLLVSQLILTTTFATNRTQHVHTSACTARSIQTRRYCRWCTGLPGFVCTLFSGQMGHCHCARSCIHECTLHRHAFHLEQVMASPCISAVWASRAPEPHYSAMSMIKLLVLKYRPSEPLPALSLLPARSWPPLALQSAPYRGGVQNFSQLQFSVNFH